MCGPALLRCARCPPLHADVRTRCLQGHPWPHTRECKQAAITVRHILKFA